MKYYTTAKTYEKAVQMLIQKRFKVIFQQCPEWKPMEIDTATEYMRRVYITASDGTEWSIRLWSVKDHRKGVLMEYTLYHQDENDEIKDWDTHTISPK
jgi:hypothetical protein